MQNTSLSYDFNNKMSRINLNVSNLEDFFKTVIQFKNKKPFQQHVGPFVDFPVTLELLPR